MNPRLFLYAGTVTAALLFAYALATLAHAVDEAVKQAWKA